MLHFTVGRSSFLLYLAYDQTQPHWCNLTVMPSNPRYNHCLKLLPRLNQEFYISFWNLNKMLHKLLLVLLCLVVQVVYSGVLPVWIPAACLMIQWGAQRNRTDVSAQPNRDVHHHWDMGDMASRKSPPERDGGWREKTAQTVCSRAT